MHHRRKTTGFTFVELMAAIVVVLILLSIFVPYLMSVREQSRRTECQNNLRQIVNGLWDYAKDNSQDFPRVTYDSAVLPDGYVAFTGVNDDNPFAPGANAAADVRSSDASASLFLLVRLNLVRPSAFICPSSSDEPDTVNDPLKRGNFSAGKNLSYSYAMPFSSSPNYKFNRDRLKAEFVLLADKNPGKGDHSNPSEPARDAPALDIARANSPNHDHAGQNVVYVTGSIEFQVTPYCGHKNDNIYTAQAISPTTQPDTPAADVNGIISDKIGPARPDDSYLVPTALDGAGQ